MARRWQWGMNRYDFKPRERHFLGVLTEETFHRFAAPGTGARPRFAPVKGGTTLPADFKRWAGFLDLELYQLMAIWRQLVKLEVIDWNKTEARYEIRPEVSLWSCLRGRRGRGAEAEAEAADGLAAEPILPLVDERPLSAAQSEVAREEAVARAGWSGWSGGGEVDADAGADDGAGDPPMDWSPVVVVAVPALGAADALAGETNAGVRGAALVPRAPELNAEPIAPGKPFVPDWQGLKEGIMDGTALERFAAILPEHERPGYRPPNKKILLPETRGLAPAAVSRPGTTGTTGTAGAGGTAKATPLASLALVRPEAKLAKGSGVAAVAETRGEKARAAMEFFSRPDIDVEGELRVDAVGNAVKPATYRQWKEFCEEHPDYALAMKNRLETKLERGRLHSPRSYVARAAITDKKMRPGRF